MTQPRRQMSPRKRRVFLWLVVATLLACAIGGKVWLHRRYVRESAIQTSRNNARDAALPYIQQFLHQLIWAGAPRETFERILRSYGPVTLIDPSDPSRAPGLSLTHIQSGYQFDVTFPLVGRPRYSYTLPPTLPNLRTWIDFQNIITWSVGLAVTLWATILYSLRFVPHRRRALGEVLIAMALLSGGLWSVNGKIDTIFRTDMARYSFWIAPAMLLSGLVLMLLPKPREKSNSLCWKCSYNLTGNMSGICPECGTPLVRRGPSAAEIARNLGSLATSKDAEEAP